MSPAPEQDARRLIDAALVQAGWLLQQIAAIRSNLIDPAQAPGAPHIAPDNIQRDTGRLLPYRTIRNDGVTSAKHRFYAGQLLYSYIRPYLNKCVRVDFEGLCSADMYLIARCSFSALFAFGRS